MKKISVDAIKIFQNNFLFFSTVLNSDILNKSCFVSRREENSAKGFQRLLNKSRARNIAQYLDGKQGAIPTAIILSAQPEAELKYDENKKQISFNVIEKAFLVLDGQHRLFGLMEAKNKYNIPLIIFSDLNTTNEVRYFIDINTTQKGVPSALILDIKHLAGTETKVEEKLRQIFDFLNKDKKSPMIGLMSPSKSQAGKISRVTFNETIEPVLESSILSSLDIEMAGRVIMNYLVASEKVLKNSKSDNAELTKTLFFRAFFAFFEDIAERSLNSSGNLKIEAFEKEMEPLEKVEYDKYSGSSKVTLSNLIKEMKSQLRYSQTITDEMV